MLLMDTQLEALWTRILAAASGEIRYDDQFSLLSSIWASTVVMLLLLVAVQFAKYMWAVMEAYKVRRPTMMTPTGERAGESEPLMGESRTMAGGRRGVSEGGIGGMTWGDRFDNAERTIHRAFIMLLAVSVFSSIPIAYSCSIDTFFPNSNNNDDDGGRRPPGPIPIPSPPHLPTPGEGGCGTCLTNGLSLATVILGWIFTALSAIWVLMEMATYSLAGSAVTGVIMGLCR
ncbi:hypothetical protein HDV05_002948 [Chytridiales sp. JEL 0842]|nr:hypothetical protein HDV05_002948 [Chytridiales sp. JEL 0842]